jgi:hypothetical protein
MKPCRRHFARNGTARFAGLKHDRLDLRGHQREGGDKDHLKVFANEDAKFGSRRTTRKALLSSIGGRGPSPLAGGF